MHTKILIALSLTLGLMGTSTAQDFGLFRKKVQNKLNELNSGDLSTEEVAEGLKEALTIGVETGVEKISQVNGYFRDPEIKIPLPEEAKQMEQRLRQMGMEDEVDETIKSLNRAAEDAAGYAKDIFIEAIKSMTISDARDILKGNQDAATIYLENTSRKALYEKFKPIVKKSLDKVDATKYWQTIFTAYNQIPFVKNINADLEDYVTNKAIDGLFVQIARQEKEIRNNPAARVTELLQRVFK